MVLSVVPDEEIDPQGFHEICVPSPLLGSIGIAFRTVYMAERSTCPKIFGVGGAAG